MVFSSLLFLFLFLPIVLTGYFLFRKNTRNFFLLAASLFFYTWGEMQFVLILMGSMTFNYLFAILIDTFQKSEPAKSREARIVLWLAVIFNLSLLGFYKYALFLTTNFNSAMQVLGLSYALTFSGIHLPLGISFFTFRALSYVIDVYNRKVTCSKNWVTISLYLSFFPLSIAGPIVRYSEMAARLVKRIVTLEMFSTGMGRLIIGLGKKCLIANTLASVADRVFALSPDRVSCELAWLGILCYTLQIYFDFSGYSDMAIGLGRMFGFDFLENFNYPYISQSIREFWRRWHISLSTWFRDYLYIPLGGNRVQPARTYGNLIIVFFFCGLWHGAEWTFVIWGLWHGFFIVLERLGFGRLIDSFWKPLRHLYVLLVVIFGWVFFRSESLSFALAYFQALFGFGKGSGLEYPLALFLNREITAALCAGVIFSGPVMTLVEVLRIKALTRSDAFSIRLMGRGISIGYAVALVFILAASVASLAGGTYNPFIYFRF
jgi:alginate O-acetyltransferase complex protein AlgI